MGYQTVLVERRGAVEIVTMNRPEVRNAQNSALLEEWMRRCARPTPIPRRA